MNQQSGRLCIFGEVLFDHFPDGRRVLGGAPFNVAWHLQAFAQAPFFISRVGADAEGDAIRSAMRDWGLDTNGLQADGALPTGRVEVQFEAGEPRYDIVHPCAYDAIAATPAAPSCRLLYHGSLALREPASRAALQALLACRPQLVFVDVNLRPPWWQPDQLRDLLRAADWVKLNGDELVQLGRHKGEPAVTARAFLERHGLSGLVLTHGARGAEVLTTTGEHVTVQPQRSVEVVDTVGAGDAFAAVMILGLTRSWPLQTTLQRAQAFASRLVGQRGATVDDPTFYRTLVDDWNLTG